MLVHLWYHGAATVERRTAGRRIGSYLLQATSAADRQLLQRVRASSISSQFPKKSSQTKADCISTHPERAAAVERQNATPSTNGRGTPRTKERTTEEHTPDNQNEATMSVHTSYHISISTAFILLSSSSSPSLPPPPSSSVASSRLDVNKAIGVIQHRSISVFVKKLPLLL
jgi:hypothetical protein